MAIKLTAYTKNIKQHMRTVTGTVRTLKSRVPVAIDMNAALVSSVPGGTLPCDFSAWLDQATVDLGKFRAEVEGSVKAAFDSHETALDQINKLVDGVRADHGETAEISI